MNMDRRWTISVALALTLAMATGCAERPTLSFEPDGTAVTAEQADSIAERADVGSLADLPVSDAAREREAVLAGLRLRGPKGEEAARLLTDGFPATVPSVPILVRYCTFDSTAAVVVVEAFGDEGSTLRHRRLWVFRRADGSIMRASSFR